MQEMELTSAHRRQGIGTNVAFYVGHNGIRNAVMKDSQRRPPTVDTPEAVPGKATLDPQARFRASSVSTSESSAY